MDNDSVASSFDDSRASGAEESTGSQRPSRRCKTLAMQGLMDGKKQAETEGWVGECGYS